MASSRDFNDKEVDENEEKLHACNLTAHSEFLKEAPELSNLLEVNKLSLLEIMDNYEQSLKQINNTMDIPTLKKDYNQFLWIIDQIHHHQDLERANKSTEEFEDAVVSDGAETDREFLGQDLEGWESEEVEEAADDVVSIPQDAIQSAKTLTGNDDDSERKTEVEEADINSDLVDDLKLFIWTATIEKRQKENELLEKQIEINCRNIERLSAKVCRGYRIQKKVENEDESKHAKGNESVGAVNLGITNLDLDLSSYLAFTAANSCCICNNPME